MKYLEVWFEFPSLWMFFGCLFIMDFFFFFLIYLLIYLFLAVLGLRCCARAFSSWGEWGLFVIVVCRLLIAVAFPVAEHGL